MVKRLTPIPDTAKNIKKDDQFLGYQFVSVKLKDGRFFEQAVQSEGFIIALKGQRDVPFLPDEIESVTPTEKRWNFRRKQKGESAKA